MKIYGENNVSRLFVNACTAINKYFRNIQNIQIEDMSVGQIEDM